MNEQSIDPIQNPVYRVVWPLAPRGVDPQAPAARLTSLDGATVGFLWDYVFRGDEIFPVLEREFVERYPDVTIIGYEEFGNTHGANEHEVIAGLGERLRERRVTAVVSGMGC